MFDLGTYPTDHPFWEFLALTTGTGGSAVIIGTAAGVAVMGIEQIKFMWYLKNIGWDRGVFVADLVGGIVQGRKKQPFCFNYKNPFYIYSLPLTKHYVRKK